MTWILLVVFMLTGKSLYVKRLHERLQEQHPDGTKLLKTIRLIEPEVDEDKVLKSLLPFLKEKYQRAPMIFHFDITSSVSTSLPQLPWPGSAVWIFAEVASYYCLGSCFCRMCVLVMEWVTQRTLYHQGVLSSVTAQRSCRVWVSTLEVLKTLCDGLGVTHPTKSPRLGWKLRSEGIFTAYHHLQGYIYTNIYSYTQKYIS